MIPASWHPDPSGRHELRYWDGAQWTEHVADGGVQATDPVEAAAQATGEQATADQTPADQTPADQYPADQYPAEQTPAAEAAPVQQAPAEQGGPRAGGRPGAITGDLIDGRYGETSSTAPGPLLQNPRMLRVRIAEPFLARQGAMVAYQGPVQFTYQGGGAAKFLKKAVTGEGLSLMRVEGQGDVFLADSEKQVHILQLDNAGISINGSSVLAFSSSLDWNVERVKGGSIVAGGLFNTTLRGTGWVAITTEGEPVVLNAGEAQTFADAQALVAWSIDLQTSIRSTFSGGSLIGRGSGEAFQVAFQGQGFVIVQPSEGDTVPPHNH